MNCLITGGAGFIGSHLADALSARGDQLTILDDLSTGRRDNIQHLLDAGKAEFVEGSVQDELLVSELVDGADTCFHLASAVGVELVVDRPLDSLLANLDGIQTVAAAASRCGTRLLYTSTSEVYGKLEGRHDEALHEESDRLYGPTTRSRWGYSASKAIGEMILYGFVREHQAEMIVVRLFNTVGPRQSGAYGMVLPRFVEQALAGEDLTVFGDGGQTRCFTHVLDAVDGIVRLAETDRAIGNVYNIGSQQEVSIRELAAQVIDRTGSRSDVRFVPYSDAYGPGFDELGRRRPDTRAIEELTGWTVRYDLDRAMDEVIASKHQAIEVRQPA